MQEKLLQFIWQGKYFKTTSLQTVCGESILILDPGQLNSQQGPDFSNARIMLNGVLWAGNIEVHCKSSHWFHHRHGTDPNYRSVILHVVWEDDDTRLSESIPTLVLQHLVPSIMLQRYTELMAQKSNIACHASLYKVPELLWPEWLQELERTRLHRKSKLVLERLETANNNWEECSWWWIARHFGGPVNSAFFESIARSIPIKILFRHRSQVIQLEALLLGQGNLLQEPSGDPYIQLLKREFNFLQHKYKLPPVHGQAQLLRMRPAGFPTVRLAQLAMLLHQWGQLFVKILTIEKLNDLEHWLDLTANDFWHYHYTLNETTHFHPKHLGREMGHHLVINAIVPILYACGRRQSQPHFQQLAINLLASLPAENNAIQRSWKREGINAKNAAESQSLVELKTAFCNLRRCLDCRVGQYLLNRLD